jgi:ZIP family zinc transporter
MARGEGVSAALFLAIFISNVLEAIGSATSMKESGTRPRTIVALCTAVAVLASLTCVGGHALQEVAGNVLQGGLNGFAAGALLVMLVGQMVPEAGEKADFRDVTCLATQTQGMAPTRTVSGAPVLTPNQWR